MNTQQKLSQARTDLILDHPFFAMPVFKLPFVETRQFEQLATDGKTLKYNPDFIERIPMDQLVTGLAHEGLHNMLLHPFRLHDIPDVDMETANEAADHVINIALEDAGMAPIDNWLCDRQYEGMSFEQVYNTLMKHKRQGNEDGDGQCQGQQPGQPGNQPGSQPGQPGTDPGSDPGQPGGNGQNQPWNFGAIEPYPGESDDGTPPSPAEIAQGEQQWKATLAQAATICKGQGKLPFGADRIIEEVMNPRVPWYELLRNYFDQFSRDDYTWTRPNQRYLHTGFYLPSLHDEAVGEVVMAVDMSGSVSTEEANTFATEVSGILEEFDSITIHVVYFDTRTHNPETFTSDDLPIKLNPKGGGGTDFRPAMEWVEENDIDPMAMIYLTDLACYDYPEEPAFPVLWVTPREPGSFRDHVPFGDVIVMEE